MERFATTWSTAMNVVVQKASLERTAPSTLMSVRAAHASMGESVMMAGPTTPVSVPQDTQVREKH